MCIRWQQHRSSKYKNRGKFSNQYFIPNYDWLIVHYPITHLLYICKYIQIVKSGDLAHVWEWVSCGVSLCTCVCNLEAMCRLSSLPLSRALRKEEFIKRNLLLQWSTATPVKHTHTFKDSQRRLCKLISFRDSVRFRHCVGRHWWNLHAFLPSVS